MTGDEAGGAGPAIAQDAAPFLQGHGRSLDLIAELDRSGRPVSLTPDIVLPENVELLQ